MVTLWYQCKLLFKNTNIQKDSPHYPLLDAELSIHLIFDEIFKVTRTSQEACQHTEATKVALLTSYFHQSIIFDERLDQELSKFLGLVEVQAPPDTTAVMEAVNSELVGFR